MEDAAATHAPGRAGPSERFGHAVAFLCLATVLVRFALDGGCESSGIPFFVSLPIRLFTSVTTALFGNGWNRPRLPMVIASVGLFVNLLGMH